MVWTPWDVKPGRATPYMFLKLICICRCQWPCMAQNMQQNEQTLPDPVFCLRARLHATSHGHEYGKVGSTAPAQGCWAPPAEWQVRGKSASPQLQALHIMSSCKLACRERLWITRGERSGQRLRGKLGKRPLSPATGWRTSNAMSLVSSVLRDSLSSGAAL